MFSSKLSKGNFNLKETVKDESANKVSRVVNFFDFSILANLFNYKSFLSMTGFLKNGFKFLVNFKKSVYLLLNWSNLKLVLNKKLSTKFSFFSKLISSKFKGSGLFFLFSFLGLGFSFYFNLGFISSSIIFSG